MARTIDRVVRDGEGPGPFTALAAIALLAVVLRALAALVLDQHVESDALAYLAIARSLAETGVPVDTFGQHAFYNIGYPALLALGLMGVGGGAGTALVLNLLLAALGCWLAAAVAFELTRRRDASLIAALGYALWLPGIWNATLLAKENLSAILFLAFALAALKTVRGARPVLAAFAGGAAWGAALLTGGSSLPLCLGMAAALALRWRADRDGRAVLLGALAFAGGALILLAPWLHATDRMLGRPVFSTNAAFNLYIGNNPAADGRFVSIADTPAGADWEATRRALGELGTADRLRAEALDWMAEYPGRAAALGARKLVYFWLPNVPDAEDIAASPLISAVRIAEMTQYLAILALGLWGFRGDAIGRDQKWVLGAAVIGFWLLHAFAYIIIRYRDPAMPLLIVMASAQLAALWRQRLGGGVPAHAA
ncbi:MAG: hypothetical protein ACK4K7_07155 [Allosphingosinicella sp.]|uniref:hypothetical protein n=1 Tax=Allosphingosinicella sp. TaxID=2823234 RepID=UPI003936771F